MLQAFLVNSWYKNSKWLYVLLPFNLIYRFILFIRKLCYKFGIFRTHKFAVPIIIVGNLTVGGTGKTPLVISLVEYLIKHGFKPGVIRRAYGGKIKKTPVLVNDQSSPEDVGDEAVLIYRRTQCPVMVSSKRVASVKSLLEKTDCNIIISDDGLQHTALARDIEILVVDGDRRFGNEQCLPVGPLRESLSRLNSVDFVICNGEPSNDEYSMQLEVDSLYNLKEPVKTSELLDLAQPVYAVAGIGNPDRFFKTLRDNQCEIYPISYPDHHNYTAADLAFKEAYPLIMTEKDAVKCSKFAQPNHWVLKVNALPEDRFYSAIHHKIQNII